MSHLRLVAVEPTLALKFLDRVRDEAGSGDVIGQFGLVFDIVRLIELLAKVILVRSVQNFLNALADLLLDVLDVFSLTIHHQHCHANFISLLKILHLIQTVVIQQPPCEIKVLLIMHVFFFVFLTIDEILGGAILIIQL